jgi:hypothetical protein
MGPIMPHRLCFLSQATGGGSEMFDRCIVLPGSAVCNGEPVNVVALCESNFARLSDGRTVDASILKVSPHAFLVTQVVVAIAMVDWIDTNIRPVSSHANAYIDALTNARDLLYANLDADTARNVNAHTDTPHIAMPELCLHLMVNSNTFNAFMANFEALTIAMALLTSKKAVVKIDTCEPVVTVCDIEQQESLSVSAFHTDPIWGQDAIVRVQDLWFTGARTDARSHNLQSDDDPIDREKEADDNMRDLLEAERNMRIRADKGRQKRREKKRRQKSNARERKISAEDADDADTVADTVSTVSTELDCVDSSREVKPEIEAEIQSWRERVHRLENELAERTSTIGRLELEIARRDAADLDSETLKTRIEDVQVRRMRDSRANEIKLYEEIERLESGIRKQREAHRSAKQDLEAQIKDCMLTNERRIDGIQNGAIDMLVHQLITYHKKRQMVLDDGCLSVGGILCNGFAAMTIVRVMRMIDPCIASDGQALCIAAMKRPGVLHMPDAQRIMVLV